MTVQENFVSDFAGFTQGSVHVRRDDTALRIYFRKDASPDPARIEVILELGHFTTGNKAANLGPFTLQILKAGVAQPIPTPTLAKPSLTSTAAHFPSMGWWTRWRWNPTPRRVVRTGSQLLPSGLNLVPNFSAALAQRYGAVDCGKSGGPPVVICDASDTAGLFGASWSDDGTIFFSESGTGISRVPSGGGLPGPPPPRPARCRTAGRGRRPR